MNARIPRNAYSLAALLLSLPISGLAQDTYVSTFMDDLNRIHIFTADAKEIVLEMASEQVGITDIKISGDGMYVGWLALYPNCCTPYPVPLALEIYSDKKKIVLAGNGLPIWNWSFSGNDKHVTFYQVTTHGDSGVHYETRDLETNQLIHEWEPEYGRDNRQLEKQDVPQWVDEFNSIFE